MALHNSLAIIALSLLTLAGHAAAQSVVAGPIVNPTFGSRYYRIQGGTYAQLQAFARSMGGDLVTIDSEAENIFLTLNFLTNVKPYIGLNDAATEGTLVWSDGSASPYRKWRQGQPANTAANDFVRFSGPTGEWELVTADISSDAIVEIRASEPIRVPQEITSLRDAINAAESIGNRQVLIAPGSYAISRQGMNDPIEIVGSGMGTTTVILTSDISLEIRADVVVRDMTLEHSSGSLAIAAFEGSPRFQNVEMKRTSTNTNTRAFLEKYGEGTVYIEGCTFSGLLGPALFSDNGFIHATNSIFRDLQSVLTTQATGSSLFTNCLFVRIGPGTLFDRSPTASIVNSIFANISGDLGPASVTQSLLPAPRTGAGNLVGDPMFANAALNDFNLLPGSPAIDAGSVTKFMAAGPEDFLDFAGALRVADDPLTPNPTAKSPIDMGPLEFQPPAPIDTCKPDFNEDGFVDDTDFVTFAQFYDNFTCP